MCFETAFNETGKGPAISLMVAGWRVSARRIARRVGSASAEKTRLSLARSVYSTMRLNIREKLLACQDFFFQKMSKQKAEAKTMLECLQLRSGRVRVVGQFPSDRPTGSCGSSNTVALIVRNRRWSTLPLRCGARHFNVKAALWQLILAQQYGRFNRQRENRRGGNGGLLEIHYRGRHLKVSYWQPISSVSIAEYSASLSPRPADGWLGYRRSPRHSLRDLQDQGPHAPSAA